MITIRKADDRGHTHLDWLDSRHTFSFGEYYDPKHMGFSVLRVINDDRVAKGQGFGSHPHRDMEIVTYVLEGEVEHQDSLGTRSVIPAGDVQRMSAGTGIVHSEFNRTDKPLHFLQIWILPERRGLEPGYEQKTLGPKDGLRLIASPKGGDGALTIHQDVNLYAGHLKAGESIDREIAPKRNAFVHVARGSLNLNGNSMSEGDGAAISDELKLTLSASKDAEVLVFDLP
jgi:quercetin 2,3-dioxygenase